MIRENKVHQIVTAIQTGAREGMQSLDQHLKSLVKLRRIPPEEAVERAVDKDSSRLDSAAGFSPGGDGGSAVRPPSASRPLTG